jgi:hypothetical protein
MNKNSLPILVAILLDATKNNELKISMHKHPNPGPQFDIGLKAEIDHEKYSLLISNIDIDTHQEIFDTQSEYANTYDISIQRTDINATEFRDLETMMAIMNWFLSNPQIKLLVLDMPDGLCINATVEVITKGGKNA